MGLLARLRGRRPPPPVVLDPHDPDLVVVLEAFDAAEADSAVLGRAEQAGLDLSQPVLLRHHLVALPDQAALQAAAELVAQDGYALHPVAADRPLAALATRTQVLTALSASQQRSRMAGLAQRLGGDVAGWDALGRVIAGARREP